MLVYQIITILPSVSVTFEMEPQLKDVIVELTSEASFVRVFPFTIDNFKSNRFIRRPSCKFQNGKIFVISAGNEFILWCFGLVDEVWVEDVELVALNNLRWRIVHVIMSLVVFVPLEPSVDTVEIARFARSVLV